MNKNTNISQQSSKLQRPYQANEGTRNSEKKSIEASPKDTITSAIRDLQSLEKYPIRDLVKHSESFGKFLKAQRLETNQVRKFLDAINQAKFKITRLKGNTSDSDNSTNTLKDDIFKAIESDIVMLKPKLAYAAARQEAAKPLSEVMSHAIDKVHSIEDFNRLVQLIESIIAYHKAEGGK
jgi:CRISPR-associated protein Csm2